MIEVHVLQYLSGYKQMIVMKQDARVSQSTICEKSRVLIADFFKLQASDKGCQIEMLCQKTAYLARTTFLWPITRPTLLKNSQMVG